MRCHEQGVAHSQMACGTGEYSKKAGKPHFKRGKEEQESAKRREPVKISPGYKLKVGIYPSACRGLRLLLGARR